MLPLLRVERGADLDVHIGGDVGGDEKMRCHHVLQALKHNIGGTTKIRETAQMADTEPIVANRLIQGGYFELSQALGVFLHPQDPEPENATFATFAAWSAESLRAEVDRDPKAGALTGTGRPAHWLYVHLADAVLGDDTVIARNIARGQGAIYEEIGTALFTLLTVVDDARMHAQPIDEAVWATFTDQLVQNADALNQRRTKLPPAHRAVDDPTVARLQQAVKPYFSILQRKLSLADDFDDRKARSELILLANLRLVAYEQSRLQPLLRRNLAYVPDALRARVGGYLFAHPTSLAIRGWQLYQRFNRWNELFDEAFAVAATRNVYSMVLGEEELRFGHDLPLPPPAHPILCDRSEGDPDRKRYEKYSYFPRQLQKLTNRDVWATWSQYDRSGGQARHTGVDNWLRYEERMSYIANLFRSRQQVSALYRRPGSTTPIVPPRPPDQLEVISLSDETTNRLGQRRAQILGDGGVLAVGGDA